jgi:hypothetical protein
MATSNYRQNYFVSNFVGIKRISGSASSRQERSGEWRVETIRFKGAAGERRVKSGTDFSI